MTETRDTLGECTETAIRIFGDAPNAGKTRDAALYLAHTGHGAAIRALAQETGQHPSTISRAVRRVEERRDDPLFDQIVSEAEAHAGTPRLARGPALPAGHRTVPTDELRREAKRFLRRLSEPGAFLLYAAGANKAGVFCEANGFDRPIAMVPLDTSAEFLRHDWIKVRSKSARVVRYRITDAGRSYLRRTLAEDARRQSPGRSDGPNPFAAQHRIEGERILADTETGEARPRRVNLGESPIGWLARRRNPDGSPMLQPAEIDAAERLRADFEAAQMGPAVAQDWRKFLTPGDRLSGTPVPGDPGDGAMAARDRVMKALAHLGPGLADAALRICCFLEGLEACEHRMGWSARSAKVVLRIALQNLARFYGIVKHDA